MPNFFGLFEKKSSLYDNVEFTLPASQTDYGLVTNQAATWHKNVKTAYGAVQIAFDQPISVKFNSTSNPSVTLATTQSPFVVDFLQINDIFISNGAVTPAMKILAVRV